MSSPAVNTLSPSVKHSSPATSPPSEKEHTLLATDSRPAPFSLSDTDPTHPLSEHSRSQDLLCNVQPSEVKILETLRDADHCAICKVEIRGRLCIMKVHHGQTERMRQFKDFFLNEVNAYRRLKKNGLCDQGVTPDFYGIIMDMASEDWPDWKIYHREFEENLPGDAILLEYVPNMQHIRMTNYTPARVEALNNILKRFHAAGIYHGDPYPRNMMFVEDEQGNDKRILWLEFEGGFTVDDPGELDGHEKAIMKQEAGLMDQFVGDMATDVYEHKGKVVETRHWWEW